MTLFHNLAVTIDRHGSLDMETYVKAALDNLSVALQRISAEFREERSALRVENDNAIVAGRLEYKPPYSSTSQVRNISDNSRSNSPDKEMSSVSLWKLIRIIRSGDRMYTLTGTLVESAGMEEIAYKDMVEIMNTFSSLKRQ